MISIVHVSYRYDRDGEDILKDICLQVGKGELVLLCGRSGCGKTTLTKALNGIIPHLSVGKLSGNVSVGRKKIAESPMYELAKTVGRCSRIPKRSFSTSIRTVR